MKIDFFTCASHVHYGDPLSSIPELDNLEGGSVGEKSNAESFIKGQIESPW